MNLRILVVAVAAPFLPCADAADDPRALLPEIYAAPAEAGRDLIGTRPPAWEVSDWLHSPPLSLEGLRGKVVLVRWWTAPDCPFCAASAGALNALWKKHRARGLVVVGMYHHKADGPLTREHVEREAGKLGFAFPIAIDAKWKTLKQWWLGKPKREWTSVTFVLDREGVIRHVHPGGAYFPGEPGFQALEREVAAALEG